MHFLQLVSKFYQMNITILPENENNITQSPISTSFMNIANSKRRIMGLEYYPVISFILLQK